MDLPIGSALSGKRLEVARLQDSVIDIVYNYVYPRAVLYGGTAVWRCYSGGRFSEDVDLYVNAPFAKRLEEALKKYGMSVVWRDEALPSHVRISDGSTEILLDGNTGMRPESAIAKYSRVDGSASTVYTMSAAELMIRKMEAYSGRKYIRDIYDIFHLTNYVKKDDYYVASKLKLFLKHIEKPVDEKILASLIYRGDREITFEKMINYLGEWSREVRE